MTACNVLAVISQLVLSRRSRYLLGVLLGSLNFLVVGTTGAQTYPSRPITLVVTYMAGGEVDRTARLLAQSLTERLGTPVNVANRGGGTDVNSGTETVARALPDGYTLLMANANNAINSTLYDNLSFDFMRDIMPVAGVVRIPPVIVAHPAFAPKSIPELIATAKGSPRKVSTAVPQIPVLILAAAAFTTSAGVELARVPYAVARADVTAINDLVAGKLDIQFAGLGAAKSHISSGKLRALAVTTPTRARALPDVPAVAEFLPGYEVMAWLGIGTPRNTDAGILDNLSRHVTAAISESVIQTRLVEEGHDPMPMGRVDFAKFVAAQVDSLGKLVKSTGLKHE